MTVTENVRSTAEEVIRKEVNFDTVYIRDNIIKIDEENFEGWGYTEIQYTVSEYIQVLTAELEESNQIIIKLTEADLDNKLALVDIYEMLI